MAGIRHIFLAGAFACLATGMLLCSCSTGSPAAPESTSSHAEESVPSHEASAPEPASADSAEPVRIGKDQVTVLVLNGCGIEGAAAEVAEKVRAAGFENVTVDNATYFNVPSTRVSYYHEETSAEAEELGDLLFAAVRVASTLERDPEQALHAACEKFIRRFTAMEQTALAEGRPLETLSKDELLAGWNAQKRVVPGGEQ